MNTESIPVSDPVAVALRGSVEAGDAWPRADAPAPRIRKHALYLLKPSVAASGRIEYCPACAEILGLLEFYPELKRHIDVRYVEAAWPRRELMDLLGYDNQDCPVLVLTEFPDDPPPGVGISHGNGQPFVEGVRSITAYLARFHGSAVPRSLPR